MYSAKENRIYIRELVKKANRSKTNDRTEVFCTDLKVCVDRTEKSIRDYELRMEKRVELSRRLPSCADPNSINSISLENRIQAFGAECIDLTDQLDYLQVLDRRYCQDRSCPLPPKIPPLNMGPPALRPQEELSWRKNPLRKLLGMIWPVSFAYYFHKFLELFRWPF